MSTKRLGKGLADIISAPAQHTGNFVLLKIDQVRSGRFQPRSVMTEPMLEELKASIKRRGVIEPIIVRPVAHGTYELVAGERRWRASQALGLSEIPAIIKSLTDREALEFSLIENIQREALNPVDEATGYRRLLDEFGYTQETVAEAVGKDRATVANTLRLLALPDEIQQGLREGVISAGHAKALLGIEGRAAQLEWYRQAAQDRVTVRALEAMVGAASVGTRRRMRRIDPQMKQIEDQVRQALGTKVTVISRKKGGRIIVEYFSAEDLTRLLQVFGVSVS